MNRRNVVILNSFLWAVGMCAAEPANYETLQTEICSLQGKNVHAGLLNSNKKVFVFELLVYFDIFRTFLNHFCQGKIALFHMIFPPFSA